MTEVWGETSQKWEAESDVCHRKIISPGMLLRAVGLVHFV